MQTLRNWSRPSDVVGGDRGSGRHCREIRISVANVRNLHAWDLLHALLRRTRFTREARVGVLPFTCAQAIHRFPAQVLLVATSS